MPSFTNENHPLQGHNLLCPHALKRRIYQRIFAKYVSGKRSDIINYVPTTGVASYKGIAWEMWIYTYSFNPLLLLYTFQTLLRDERHCETATGSLRQLQGVALLDGLLRYGVCLGVLLIVRILSVGVDGTLVLTALVEEVELDG